MTVYVITACYNCINTLDDYFKSLSKSVNALNEDFKLHIVFVIDDPTNAPQIADIINSYKFDYVTKSILFNEDNLGCTRSRNRAANFILGLITEGDYVTYFDSDDTWSDTALSDLYQCLTENKIYDLIYLPIPPVQDDLVEKVMPLGEFCNRIPLQESTYVWSYEYFYHLIDKYGTLYYQDNSESKYFPEDMRMIQEFKFHVKITKYSICHRIYDNGNIAKNWRSTIIKNKLAFRKLWEFRTQLNKFYPLLNDEIKEYYKWIDYLTRDTIFILTYLNDNLSELKEYIKSFNDSYSIYQYDSKILYFIFIVADDDKYNEYKSEIDKLVKDNAIKVEILSNKGSYIGYTKSINKAASHVYLKIREGDSVIKFDVENKWNSNAVSTLNVGSPIGIDMVMYPIPPIKITTNRISSLGKYALNNQNSVYRWEYKYFIALYNYHRELEYGVESIKGYIPENIMLMKEYDSECYISPDSICTSDGKYNNKNINEETKLIMYSELYNLGLINNDYSKLTDKYVKDNE